MDTENTPSVDSLGTTTTTEGDSTSQVADQATDTSSQSDGTTSETHFDPLNIPEELKPVYKQMQADYTKKTQEIAQQRKEFEALKAQADKFKQYEQYTPILEEMLGTANKQSALNNPEMAALEADLKQRGYSPEAIEMMKIGAGFVLNQVNQTQSQKEESIRLNTGIAQAEKLDPRLADTNLAYTLPDGQKVAFGTIVANYVRSDPNWTKDPVGATKQAIALVDALIGQAKTEGKQELSASAKQKATKFPPVNASSLTASDNSSPSTMREAAALARKELGQ